MWSERTAWDSISWVASSVVMNLAGQWASHEPSDRTSYPSISGGSGGTPGEAIVSVAMRVTGPFRDGVNSLRLAVTLYGMTWVKRRMGRSIWRVGGIL